MAYGVSVIGNDESMVEPVASELSADERAELSSLLQFQSLLDENLTARGFTSNDMGRVADAVGSLWEHRDDLLDVVDWLRDHRDDVTNLISKLPDLVASAGDGIVKAGESAMSAAKFLVGGDGDDEFSAVDLAHVAADALDRCRQELADAHELIRRLGDEVDDITVPSVKPRYVKVAGLSVIAGLDIGQSNLADDAADKIRGGADRLVGISDGLETVSEQLRRLGGAVTDAGSQLHAVGGFLESSGGQLSGLTVALFSASGGPTPRRASGDGPAGALSSDVSSVPSIGLGGTAAAKKPAATKKPAPTKKPAAKKAPARKTPPK